MATATAVVRQHPGRRYDHYFFSGMAILILASVFLGFARTYYLAGTFRAPLPAPIIHLHGAAFSCWILLLITQTSLVSAHRVDLHRRLGVVGFLLAAVMVVLGMLAATNALSRNFAPPGLDPLTFYVIPMSDMVIFPVFIFFAYRARFDPATHKRLIMLATISLLIAAIARWPFAWTFGKPLNGQAVICMFLLLLIAYDLWSQGKIHRATLWGSISLVAMQLIRVPLGKTAIWHAFAAWAQKLG